jgi:adhesin HecA-like repeat protein
VLLDGATIKDTLVMGAGGNLLLRSGTLNNVALARGATIVGTTGFGNSATINFSGGLRLNDSAIVESGALPASTQVFFRGTQTLAGTGTIDVGFVPVGFQVRDGTLTIEPGITIRDANWLIRNATVVNYGTVRPAHDALFAETLTTNDRFVNRGLIEAVAGVRVDVEATIDNSAGILRANGGHLRIGDSSSDG